VAEKNVRDGQAQTTGFRAGFFAGPAVVVLGAVVAVWVANHRSLGDFSHMLEPMQRIAAGQWGDVYSAETQGTSLTGWLAVTVVPFLLGRSITSDQGAWVLAGLVAVPMLVAAVRFSVRAIDPTVSVTRAWLLAGLSLLLPTTLASWTEYYHPQDVAGAALVVFALGLAAKHQWLGAGAVFGVAILTRQWAVLVALVVAPLTGTRRNFLLYAAGGAVVCVAGLAPLLLAGNPGVFDALTGNKAAITGHTFVGRLVGEGGSDTLDFVRLIPLALVAVLAVWLTFTKKANMYWLAPLAVTALAARMLFDVAAYTYYWAPICIILLLVRGGKFLTPALAAVSSVLAWALYPQLASAGQTGQLLMAIWLPVLLVTLTAVVWFINDNESGEPETPSSPAGNTPVAWGAWVAAAVVSVAILVPGLGAVAAHEQANPDGTIPESMFDGYGTIIATGEPLQRTDTGTLTGNLPTIASDPVNDRPATIFPGTTRLIVMVSHWCETCPKAIEATRLWVTTTGTPWESVALVVTGTDQQQGNWPPELWLATLNWDGAVILDDAASQARTLLGDPDTLPAFIIVNADGAVAASHFGPFDGRTLDTSAANTR
jgi:heme/copper-type cytochrome/quinol oxidase subunit 2